MNLLSELTNNATLLLALAVVYSLFIGRVEQEAKYTQIWIGLLFGAVAVTGILLSVHLLPGVMFDGRSVVLSLGGLFGGSIVAGIAALMAAACRIWLGGAGTYMGLAVIATSAALGVAGLHLRRRGLLRLGPVSLLIFGLGVHACCLACAALLPPDIRWQVVDGIALPYLSVLPLATVLFGMLMLLIENRQQAEERLRLHAAVVASTHDSVMVTDRHGRIVAVNPAFARTTGYSEAESLGQNPSLLRSGRHGPEFYQALWRDLTVSGHWQGQIWNRRKNGEIFPEWLSISTVHKSEERPTHYVSVATDISQLMESEERLRHLAHYDPLTDLPNRLLIHSRLEHALDAARRHGSRTGVLFIDLDHFKTVNDSLGHPAGDELLRAVARRVGDRLREEDTLGRLGGDEFLVLLERIVRPEDAAVVARDILRSLGKPFTLSTGVEFYIHASIGISVYPEDGADAHDLVRNADAAMYRAKDQGRNTYGFYTADLTRAASERLEMETRLRHALEQEEFVLHYQPLLSVSDGSVIGAEALLRWQPPGEELIPPDRFIPVAEETGLIVPLGEWVLHQACSQARAWVDACPSLRTLAVNISAQQFRRGDIGDCVRRVLADTGLPATILELEITESGLMEQGRWATDVLHTLKGSGLHLAVDDFGTGYSSLAYLKRLPLDKLKIDRSFVRDIPGDPNDMAIAATIIAMARSLGLEVLAEGVETEAQLDFLREQGCDFYQGYLFSPPVPAEEFSCRYMGLA